MTTNGSCPSPDRIRTVALCGHGGTGKTTLTESLLFCSGTVSRLGKVEDGNTVTDFDPDEIKRHISVSTAVAPLMWRDTKINLLDTPGYADFLGDVIAAMRVADGAIVTMDAAAGVEVGTEHVWQLAVDRQLPRMLFVNKMDRENADFDRALASARAAFGSCVVPIHLPIGSAKGFRGIVDILHERAMIFPNGHGEPEITTIPDDMREAVDAARMTMVEAIAERNEDLMIRYLEDESISNDELALSLREDIRRGEIVPVLCGSASILIGVCPLLDEMLELIPAAAEADEHATTTETDVALVPDADEPLVAFAFKTVADPHVGRVTYFRVYQGTLSANGHVTNASRQAGERIGHVFHVRGKEHVPVDGIGPGDIGAVGKLASVMTGDTIVCDGHSETLTGMRLPSPSYAACIHPKSKNDLDKLGPALQRIVEEDPTLHLDRDPISHEPVLQGLGEPHIQIAVERMSRRYHLEVELGLPRVAYRETITSSVTSDYKHKKQTGGAGQFGHVALRLEPWADGDLDFVIEVVGGSVPRNFYPAVEKGIREAMEAGPIAGYPAVNLRVALVDGSSHAVDSNEMSFKIAAREALKRGMILASPALLEPIMTVEVVVPDGMLGDVMGDLNTKRAHVSGVDPGVTGLTTVTAEVPASEIQRYATDLRSLTQGRGSFTATFSRYDVVPTHITEKIRTEHATAAA